MSRLTQFYGSRNRSSQAIFKALVRFPKVEKSDIIPAYHQQKSGNVLEEPLNAKTDEIDRNLSRTVIKEPLYTMAQESKGQGTLFPVIIEANDEYHLGRASAVASLYELVTEVGAADSVMKDSGAQAVSIGGSQNPYLKAELSGAAILALVDEDLKQAHSEQDAEVAKNERKEDTGEPAFTISPKKVVNYLLVRRIWYDFPLRPLIDQSIVTVKADAARRAFLAEGRQIVWAVIDSGIDKEHEHFKDLCNLKVTAPVVHCDFTVAGGSNGADSALVDKFGHGTHVAGIIAGSLNCSKSKIVARRARLGANDKIETFEENLPQIAGMAPCCTLVSMKVLNDKGAGNVSNIIDAIDKIQTINDFGRNLKIHGVNLSVGYEFDPAWFACGQSPVCVEVNRLVRSGVVVVVAAGNTGYGALSANERPTGAGLMLTINDPGNADLAITVGSTHRDAPHTYGVSYFSSKGPTGDGRNKPDLVAPGERILSCCTSAISRDNATNTYVERTGTSMAAPHVSGVIAGFLSIRREYVGFPEKVKDLFMAAATDLGRNSYFQGRGLVDLMRAIQSV